MWVIFVWRLRMLMIGDCIGRFLFFFYKNIRTCPVRIFLRAGRFARILRRDLDSTCTKSNWPIYGNSPTRSCNFTPLEFFLWGFRKSLVYVNKSQTTGALKVIQTSTIVPIHPNLCDRVIEDRTKIGVHFTKKNVT